MSDHLRSTSRLAGEFAASSGAEGMGRLAGLWHDLGKYSAAFQDYLRECSDWDEDVPGARTRGRIDHSTAGAKHAATHGGIGRLIAYCIAGHHAGLPDDEGEASSLRERLLKSIEPIDAAPPEILSPPGLLPSDKPASPRLASTSEPGFSLGFLTRMLFSALVDADYLDTERALDEEKANLRQGDPVSCRTLLERLDDHLGRMQSQAPDTAVNRRRAEVLDSCRLKAGLNPGFFSLDVPTGGGKTLASLAFALTHADQHADRRGLRRVIYAIPFTSIIEQTADTFREALGDLGGVVLEHHGNLDADDPARQTPRLKLAAENFDAPLVVTTNVQLFESLFAYRPSRCRKLHRLARSVIILDEAQALPPRLLAPTLAALRELVANHGATVVLCTATQPAVERRDGFGIGLEGIRPIIDDPLSLHRAMRRTVVEQLGRLEDEELAGRLRAGSQVLCVVNSRRHASDLFQRLGGPDAFHLSASMCADHRSRVVDEIKLRLKAGKPCRVISSQVIEAGVDVDFPVVYRAAAGLDSIAQAAGRCNREGVLTDEAGRPSPGRVIVFDYDAKKYPTDPLIAQAAARFREVAFDHEDDLLSPGAIADYFRLHYWQQGGDDGRGWDRGVEGQSIMDCFRPDKTDLLHAQFREAGDAYRLIDDAQAPILVPYGEKGEALIGELEGFPDEVEPGRLRAFDRAAQRYVVGIYQNGLARLHGNGALLERHGRFYLGNRDAYDGTVGLRSDVLGLDLDRLLI
ncbi:CRISPR-associated endonuclease Cas3'' [Tundrisphaera sp. TA3]|uniref:CRISPR-associated endonuclease Cas3'' n=1 Tax=Tundrisphaera sp. TA3 TaxID=3435775 RepID=UPI003EBC6DBE